MAILSKEEFLSVLKERVGESTEDADLKFLEDMTDTYNSLIKEDSTDWKQKYEENDAAWKKRYKERFFSGGEETEETNKKEPEKEEPDEEERAKTVMPEDLFKSKKEDK